MTITDEQCEAIFDQQLTAKTKQEYSGWLDLIELVWFLRALEDGTADFCEIRGHAIWAHQWKFQRPPGHQPVNANHV